MDYPQFTYTHYVLTAVYLFIYSLIVIYSTIDY